MLLRWIDLWVGEREIYVNVLLILVYQRVKSWALISLSSDICRSQRIERMLRTKVNTACTMKSSSSDRSSQSCEQVLDQKSSNRQQTLSRTGWTVATRKSKSFSLAKFYEKVCLHREDQIESYTRSWFFVNEILFSDRYSSMPHLEVFSRRNRPEEVWLNWPIF